MTSEQWAAISKDVCVALWGEPNGKLSRGFPKATVGDGATRDPEALKLTRACGKTSRQTRAGGCEIQTVPFSL